MYPAELTVAIAVLLLDHVPPVVLLSVTYIPLPTQMPPDDGVIGPTVANEAKDATIARIEKKNFFILFCFFWFMNLSGFPDIIQDEILSDNVSRQFIFILYINVNAAFHKNMKRRHFNLKIIFYWLIINLFA
jgi:hypothetical protein